MLAISPLFSRLSLVMCGMHKPKHVIRVHCRLYVHVGVDYNEHLQGLQDVLVCVMSAVVVISSTVTHTQCLPDCPDFWNNSQAHHIIRKNRHIIKQMGPLEKKT